MSSLTHPLRAADQTLETLLRNPRRRTVLRILADRDPPIALEDLARTVATHGTDREVLPEDDLEHIAVELHHNHLPRLDAADVLEYDERANVVVSLRVEDLAPDAPVS